MSNRADFLDMREQEAFENNYMQNPQVEQQPVEKKLVLITGGCYRIDYDDYYLLFKLLKHSYSSGFKFMCDRIVSSKDIEKDNIKVKFTTNTLRNIKPASASEEEILKRPLQGDFLKDRADREIINSGSGSVSGLKARGKLFTPVQYHHNAVPLTTRQKTPHYYPEYKPSRFAMDKYDLEKFRRNERKNEKL